MHSLARTGQLATKIWTKVSKNWNEHVTTLLHYYKSEEEMTITATIMQIPSKF